MAEWMFDRSGRACLILDGDRVRNDHGSVIGWISGQGRNYVLAMLTAANPTEAYGIDTIETVAGDVYRILGR